MIKYSVFVIITYVIIDREMDVILTYFHYVEVVMDVTLGTPNF